MSGLIDWKPAAITARSLTKATCAKWSYGTGRYNGRPVQVANYCDPSSGRVVAQKLRFSDKTFIWLGDGKRQPYLWGQHLWKAGGKQIVVTEGEIDALTVSQLNGNKWPVVSVPTGAAGAADAVARSIGYLESFESVIFMFDSDEPGQSAANECARLIRPGAARIARLPGKDPSELFVSGNGAAVIDAMWSAPAWSPPGVVRIDDIIEAASKPTEWGQEWGHAGLHALTYGIRPKELYALGAGVGSGKTDLFNQWIADSIRSRPEPVGAIFLEQPPVETARRLAGKLAGKPFHIPDGPWKKTELVKALELVRGRVHLYNQECAHDWPTIAATIKFLALSYGCKRIYLDHLTALTAYEEDERRGLDRIMFELAGLADNLNVSIFFVSHLATPTGTPHEEGGRVQAKHFRGSRAIMQWSHFMFGLERNQQASTEEERRTAFLRVLKDRLTGQATGKGVSLLYDPATGLLNETGSECPFTQPANEHQPFNDKDSDGGEDY